MRVFLALKSDQLLDAVIDDACMAWQPLRCHDPRDRHLTLLFLGEKQLHECYEIIETVDETLMQPRGALVWRAEQLGGFTPAKHKHWAWQGPSNDGLDQFRLRLSSALQLPMTQWLPHVTLAYGPISDAPVKPMVQTVTLSQLVLYRSLSQEERVDQANWSKVRYAAVKIWDL